MSTASLRADVPATLHPFARPANADYVEIVRGDGAHVWDADGKRYVDALASLWYCAVGHGRTEIADAIAEQARTLAGFHTFEKFTNPPAARLAERLVGLAPMPDARVMFTQSGSEAVDSAIKLARLAHALEGAPERTVLIARTPSYHGVTYGGMTATGLPPNREAFGPGIGDVVHVPYDDLEATRRALEANAGRVAAVIAEPVVGAGGVWPPPDGYLPGVRELCDAHGALLIADEVVCGFGRLGTWWGSQHYGVVPDIATFAKAVTCGYVPLGGVLVGARVRAALEADEGFMLRHGHTYAGHPTACAAGLAALDLIEGEGLLDRAGPVGTRLSKGLDALAEEGLVASVRGAGAVWAVGLHEGDPAPAVRDGMLERGVIARPIGADTIAFCPPLVIDDGDVDACVDALADALRARRAA